MSTLTTAPVAPLLERLFKEAETVRWEAIPGVGDLSADEHKRMMRSKTDYLDFYGRLKDAPLPVSREIGKLLYMLARSTGAKAVVEYGTSFGISTIYLAAALRDNGGGTLITTEFEPSKIVRAKANLAAGGLEDLVQFRAGDALKTLRADLPAAIDLVLLDGAKALYTDILILLEPNLRPGALVVADNTDYSPEYLARVRSIANGYLSVPFGDDVELSIRCG